jgi:outer membrane lipoprotein SlyB
VSAAEATKLSIVKIAAGAVIVLCAVGVGAITGLLPGVSSKEKPATAVESPAATTNTESDGAAGVTQPAKEAATKPVAREHAKAAAPATRHVAAAQPIEQEKAPPPICRECGVVESVNAVEVKGQSSGAGAVAGGIAGLILGNQIGQKNGRTLAKIAGAAGGAYLGNEIEKNAKKTMQYQVAVRMDDGTERTITQTSDPGLTAGARVKIVDGAIVPN